MAKEAPGPARDPAEEEPKKARKAPTGLLPELPREQTSMAVAIAAAAVLLVCLPCGYCWLDQGRAERADRYRAMAHADEEGSCYNGLGGHHAPALQVGRDYMHEVMSGGLNGLLIMVTTVLAGIGADVPNKWIFSMSAASLTAYSCSMGFSSFVVESAKNEFSRSQMAMEYEEVRARPHDEVQEMICHYRNRGVSEEDARAITTTLSKYESVWVEHMMAEELGVQLPRARTAPVTSGLATSVSFLISGTVPLLGMIASIVMRRLRGPEWYHPQFSMLVALALTGTALTLLGIMLGRAVGSRSPILHGLLMLANGCVASVAALSLGKYCARCCQSQDEPLLHHDTLAKPPKSPSALQSPLARPATPPDADAGWLRFRCHFFRGLAVLWVAVCTVIVCVQLVERLAYESLRVFLYGLLTCVTTGLGALPFALINVETIGEGALAMANAVAGGMMLSASAGMVWEAHEHSGPLDWQIIVGLALGALFIKASQQVHGGDDDEEDVVALHNAFIERRHLKKALLIFTVMFCHSAAEGIAVGVAFSKQLRDSFGCYVSLLLAVHNVPEGLAVALVLVPRGVSVSLAAVIATLTSVPQPLLALTAFLFVDAFTWLLPIGLSFASGAMVYVCLQELLSDAVEQLGWMRALQATAVSGATMAVVMAGLHSHVEL